MKKKIIIGAIILAFVAICYFIISSPKNNYEKKYNRFIINKEYKEDLKNDNIYNSPFFYSIFDLDNDDIPELIIRVKNDDGNEINALYRLVNNKVTYIDTIYSYESIKYNKELNAIVYTAEMKNQSYGWIYEVVGLEKDGLKSKDRVGVTIDNNTYSYYSGTDKFNLKVLTKEEFDRFMDNNKELEYEQIIKK